MCSSDLVVSAGMQAEGQAAPESTDPEVAKRRAEEEEEKRLAAIRAQGEAVTPETFARWRHKFEAEASLRSTKRVPALLICALMLQMQCNAALPLQIMVQPLMNWIRGLIMMLCLHLVPRYILI